MAMVRGLKIGRWVSGNMRVSKYVESFRTNRVDTVSIVEAIIIVEKVVERVERQVFKIIVLFVN